MSKRKIPCQLLGATQSFNSYHLPSVHESPFREGLGDEPCNNCSLVPFYSCFWHLLIFFPQEPCCPGPAHCDETFTHVPPVSTQAPLNLYLWDAAPVPTNHPCWGSPCLNTVLCSSGHPLQVPFLSPPRLLLFHHLCSAQELASAHTHKMCQDWGQGFLFWWWCCLLWWWCCLFLHGFSTNFGKLFPVAAIFSLPQRVQRWCGQGIALYSMEV